MALELITYTAKQAQDLLQAAPMRFAGEDRWGIPYTEIEIDGVWLQLAIAPFHALEYTDQYGYPKVGFTLEESRRWALDHLTHGSKRQGQQWLVLSDQQPATLHGKACR